MEVRSVANLSRAQVVFALTGMVLTLLTATMNQALGIPAIPRAIASLNGFARYPWVATSHLLTTTLAMPVFAKLSDLYGRKWLYLGATASFVVSLLLCGAAGNLPVPLDGMNQLIVARGLLGIGNGAIIALTFTLVADLFPPSERGRYQGILSAVYGFSFIIGPGLGGWITDHFSWRWTYYVNVPLGVLAIAAVYFTLPDSRPHRARRSIDWAGMATLCGWIVPLLIAMTWIGQSSGSAPSIEALLAAAAVFLLAFILVERRAAEPLLALDLFHDRRISLMWVNFFLLGICLFGVAVYLSLFIQGVLGESAVKSGLVFAGYTLSVMASNLLSGQMVSRIGRHRPFAIGGCGLAACGLFLMSQMNASTTHPVLLGNAILCGIGFGMLTPTYEVLVQNAAPKEQLGVATGFTQFSQTIGGTIGLAIFGTILLRVYHLHIDSLIPPGTPRALTQAFDNPLQLFFTRPNLETAFAQLANGRVLLASLLEGAHIGLLSALRSIFMYSAWMMALSFVLNLFLNDESAQKDH